MTDRPTSTCSVASADSRLPQDGPDTQPLASAKSLSPAVRIAVKDDGTLCDQLIRERFKLSMEFLVIGTAENEKVFGTIVQLITVDVMDNLALGDAPTNHLFCDKGVLVDVWECTAGVGRINAVIAPFVNVPSALPLRVLLPADQALFELGKPGFFSMVLKGLVANTNRPADRPETLSGLNASFQFINRNGHCVWDSARHVAVLSADRIIPDVLSA